MYLLIDNYDSFTYNLYHYFLELGAKIEVYRNDKITPEAILKKKYKGINKKSLINRNLYNKSYSKRSCNRENMGRCSNGCISETTIINV